jgi:hypothetical protein
VTPRGITVNILLYDLLQAHKDDGAPIQFVIPNWMETIVKRERL